MKKLLSLLIYITIFISAFFSADIIVSSYDYSEIGGLYYSPLSGFYALTDEKNDIKVFDKNNSMKYYFETENRPSAVSWTEDENYIISGNTDGSINVFNIISNLYSFTVRDTTESITSVDVKDRNIYYASYDKNVYVYNITKRKQTFSYKLKGTPFTVRLFGNNTLVTGDSLGYIYFINLLDNSVSFRKLSDSAIKKINIYNDEISFFAADGRVYVLDNTFRTVNSFYLGNPVKQVINSPDGSYFGVLFTNNEFEIYSTESYISTLSVTFSKFTVKTINWSETWRYIFISDGSDIYRLTYPSGILEKINENKIAVPQNIIWKDKYVIYSDDDARVGFFNVETGKIDINYKVDENFNDFDIYDDVLAGVSDSGYFRIYDLLSGIKLDQKYVTDSKINNIKFSPDGKYIVLGGLDNNIYVYRYPELTLYKVIKNLHKSWIKDIDFSKDSKYISVASLDKTVTISAFPDFEKTYTLNSFKYNIWSADWSNKKNLITLGGFEGILEIWDPIFQTVFVRTGISTGSINSLKWSYDDSYIAEGSEDKNIYIWSSSTGELLQIFSGSKSSVTDLYWNKGGRYLASLSLDNIIRIWDINNSQNIASLITYKDGKYVSFKNSGEYLTNIFVNEEEKYFFKYSPISIFETIYFSKVNSLDLREGEPPVISAEDKVLINSPEYTIKISFSDNSEVRNVNIGNENFDINSKNYVMDYVIDIERLSSDTLKIVAFDDSGNKTEKDINIEFKDIYLLVISNQVVVKNSSGNAIGTLTRGQRVKMIGREGDSYIIDYFGQKGYVKYYMLKK
ncbi:MAG: WD40 repeat domain-containing protein [Thermotogae bacterium]|nr:WD40 repeat domain-containing protein [Thermotogota bacterium]